MEAARYLTPLGVAALLFAALLVGAPSLQVLRGLKTGRSVAGLIVAGLSFGLIGIGLIFPNPWSTAAARKTFRSAATRTRRQTLSSAEASATARKRSSLANDTSPPPCACLRRHGAAAPSRPVRGRHGQGLEVCHHRRGRLPRGGRGDPPYIRNRYCSFAKNARLVRRSPLS